MKRATHNLLIKKRIQTFGNSMYPLLHDKDIVYFETSPFSEIQVNDIVIAAYQDAFITHRVIYKTSQYVITKGDNNLKADSKIPKKDVKGKLQYVVRHGRKINPEHLYTIQSANYFKEIVNLEKILERKNIKHFFLKGLPLHLYYQRKIPRRLYADCDILIQEKDLPNVINLLTIHGYASIDTSIMANDSVKKKEFSFFKKVNNYGIVFDLHIEPVFMMLQLENGLFYKQELVTQMTDDFFQNITLIHVQGSLMPILSGVHLTMYLALHFFHHNFKENFRLELIDKVIRTE